MLKSLASYLGGFVASTTLSSPAEWLIHRYMLHPKSRNPINTSSAISHNDEHHGAYSGPEHYYRDVTNSEQTIHFSGKWVGIIHAISAALGAGIHEGLSRTPYLEQEYDGEKTAFVAGFLTGTATYYAAYEILHHYMHVIGQRRYRINTTFANNLQEIPDGKLRFSKPTLDDLCNHVEKRIDTKDFRDPELIERLEQELQYNHTQSHHQRAKGEPSLKQLSIEDALEDTVDTMRKKEIEYRDALGFWGRRKYAAERFLHRQLRASPAFQFIDNHHFVHHFRYYKNLNVVLPLADILQRTKVDSTKEHLRDQKAYWLCPNSPETEKFDLEKELAAQQEISAGKSQ